MSNEILLETNDAAKVTAFINRFGGRKTDTLAAEPGTEGSVALHTVRMDPARLLDTSRLAADLETLDPGYSGEITTASDQQTLRLLATTARAVVEGYPAQLNLVMRPHDVASGSTRDNPAVQTPAGWNPDAFTWSYLNNNTRQDIEVTTAWQQLNRLGLLRPTVNIGMVDAGFDPDVNRDFPATTGLVSGALTQRLGDELGRLPRHQDGQRPRRLCSTTGSAPPAPPARSSTACTPSTTASARCGPGPADCASSASATPTSRSST